MPTLTRKKKPISNSTLHTPLLAERARSSSTNTMSALLPPYHYNSHRAARKQEEFNNIEKTKMKNEIRNLQNITKKVINAEKNKKKIRKKYEDYDDDDEDDDPEIVGFKTWRTCEGDIPTLRKSPTIINFKNITGGKKHKKKTRKHRKHKKRIVYNKKA